MTPGRPKGSVDGPAFRAKQATDHKFNGGPPRQKSRHTRADTPGEAPGGRFPPGMQSVTFHESLGSDPEGREDERYPTHDDDAVVRRLIQTLARHAFDMGAKGAGQRLVELLQETGEFRLVRHFAGRAMAAGEQVGEAAGRVLLAPYHGRKLEGDARERDERARQRDEREQVDLDAAQGHDTEARTYRDRHDALEPRYQAQPRSEALGALVGLAVAAGLLLYPALKEALNTTETAVAVVAGLVVEGIAVGAVWLLGRQVGDFIAPSEQLAASRPAADTERSEGGPPQLEKGSNGWLARRLVLVGAAAAIAFLAIATVGVILARAEAWFVAPLLIVLWIATGLGSLSDGLRALGRALRARESEEREAGERARRVAEEEGEAAEGEREAARQLRERAWGVAEQLARDLARLANAPANAELLQKQEAAAIAQNDAVVAAETSRGSLLRVAAGEVDTGGERQPSPGTFRSARHRFRSVGLGGLAGSVTAIAAVALGAAVTSALALGIATVALAMLVLPAAREQSKLFTFSAVEETR